MKTKTIYICECCGKESVVEDKLKRHEVACKRERKLAEKRKQMKETWDQEFLKSFSFDRLFNDQINEYLERVCGDSFEELSIDVKLTKEASNSHAAPIGKPKNWRRKDHLPKGYPGWVGTVYGTYSKKGKTMKDIRIPGINTGSGFGSAKTFEYGITIFAEDFPKLQALYARQLLNETV